MSMKYIILGEENNYYVERKNKKNASRTKLTDRMGVTVIFATKEKALTTIERIKKDE